MFNKTFSGCKVITRIYLTVPLVLKMLTNKLIEFVLTNEVLKLVPLFIETHYANKVIEIIELQKKLRKIEAIENYFEKYLLFELKTITQQKKGKIQQKIKKILDTSTSRCIRKIQLYSRILKKLKGTRELLKHLKKDNGACIEGVVDI